MAGRGGAPARRLAAAPHAVADPAALELRAAARRRPRGPGARGGLLRAPRGPGARPGLARRGARRPRRRAGRPGLDTRRADGRPGGRRRRRAGRDGARRGGACRPARRGWIAAWAACEQRPDADEHARTVLARIEPATAYARAAGDLGVGLAVCERGWAGLFCVATAPTARRRGIAGHVVHALTRGPSSAARGASISRSRAPTRQPTPSTSAPASRAHTAITTGRPPMKGGL